MNKKYIIAFIAFVTLASVSYVHAQTFDASLWRSKGTVNVSAVSEDGLARILLGRPFVAYTGLTPNVRVLSSGVEIPYTQDSLVSGAEGTQYASLSDSWKTANGSGVIADLGKEGVIHDKASLTISSNGSYKKQVSIYTSSVKYAVDDPRWRLVTDQGYVWSYRDDKANFFASNTSVTYPRQSSRFIKILIHSGEGTVDGITGVSFLGNAAAQEMREEKFQARAALSEDSERNETVMVLDFDRVEHLKSIELSTEDKNFNRRVSIEYYTESGEKRFAQAGYIFSVATSLFSHKQLTLPLGQGILTNKIELRIINENNKPILISPDVTLVSPVASIIAKVGRVGQAEVYLEGRDLSPRYDLASFVGYASQNIPESKVGGFGANPEYKEPEPPKQPLSENKIIFIPLVLLAAGILGGFTVAYFRKLKKDGVSSSSDGDQNRPLV